MPRPRKCNPVSISAVLAYQTCPRKYYYLYVQGIQPRQLAAPLSRGKAVHQAIADYLQGREYGFDEAEDRAINLQCQAIMRAYIATPRDWEALAMEYKWSKKLWRYGPDCHGVVDQMVRQNGEVGILETKVRSRRHGIESLWDDLQLAIYMAATDARFAIYETLLFSNIDLKLGETDEEFELRKSTMAQPGRAKQQVAETDEEYIERVKVNIERYRIERDDRVIVDRLEELRLWSAMMRVPPYPCKSGACTSEFGHKCGFYDLCLSHNSPAVLEGLYEKRVSHLTNTNDVVE